MLQKVFIHADERDMFGAKLAKFSIERKLSSSSSIHVELLRNSPSDPELTRFSVPVKMAYTGRAIFLAANIFAVQDITPLMNLELGDNRVAACKAKDGFDTSVMVMDCEKLKDWKMNDFELALKEKLVSKPQILNLSIEPDVLDIARSWNSLDILTLGTKLLHITDPLIRPWKAGLPLDFVPATMPKIFGVIPREPLLKMLGRLPEHYASHSDKNIDAFFADLVRGAHKAGALDDAFIKKEVAEKRLHPDILFLVKKEKNETI